METHLQQNFARLETADATGSEEPQSAQSFSSKRIPGCLPHDLHQDLVSEKFVFYAELANRLNVEHISIGVQVTFDVFTWIISKGHWNGGEMTKGV